MTAAAALIGGAVAGTLLVPHAPRLAPVLQLLCLGGAGLGSLWLIPTVKESA